MLQIPQRDPALKKQSAQGIAHGSLWATGFRKGKMMPPDGSCGQRKGKESRTGGRDGQSETERGKARTCLADVGVRVTREERIKENAKSRPQHPSHFNQSKDRILLV